MYAVVYQSSGESLRQTRDKGKNALFRNTVPGSCDACVHGEIKEETVKNFLKLI